MRTRQKNHSIDSLFAFLLLLIFCLFTLLLSGMGSTIYQNGTAYLNENYTSRTAAAYVAEKVRQHDEAGAVFMASINTAVSDRSIPALALRDTIDGTDFITYVYFYDNALCELMVQEDKSPEAAMGSRIVELSSLAIEPVSGTNLLSVTAVGEEGRELSELIRVSGGINSLE